MIATRLRWYLDQSGLPYEVLPHPHSSSSLETARAAHVRPDKLVKPVLLEDERGYVMAVVPASALANGSAPARKSATAASFPGLASRRTNSASLTMVELPFR